MQDSPDPMHAADATPAAPADMPEALAFEALRARALGRLQRLAGATWTDHNTHDPGITLLETLCYAITDLAYRTAFSVPDLLASAGQPGSAGFFTAAQVLPSAPVTLDDLRKLVVDLAGVRNAWIEPVHEPLGQHDAAQGLLGAMPLPVGGVGGSGGGSNGDSGPGSNVSGSADAASPNVSPLRPLGLYRVWIEKSGLGEDVDGGLLVRRAAERLQHWRGLGEDIVAIAVLDPQPVALDAAIEVAPGADEAELLAGLYEALTGYMSPALPFCSLHEMQERGWRVDQIFDGPLLSSGFLDPLAWAALQRRSSLRLSDLIQVLMAVPGVLAVKSLGFLRDGRVSRDWLLAIEPQRSASFDLAGSNLRLERRGLRADHESHRASARRLHESRLRRSVRSTAVGERDIPPPIGRDRQVARYLPIAHHLPAAYGVGLAGLSSNEPPERLAQARQLKAYLMFYDQLLANQFAQLGGAGRLLSFTDDTDRATFAQVVPDEGGALQLASVRRLPLAEHQAQVARFTEDPWGEAQAAQRGLARRHRMVDHLLARLGERWDGQGADPGPGGATDAATPASVAESWLARSLRDKQGFLRDAPAQTLRRGVGFNSLAAGDAGAQGLPAAPDESAGLAGRLLRLLGLAAPAGSPVRLIIVEHILLRPLPGDRMQQGPLMRSVRSRDPFSLQISVVMAPDAGRFDDADMRLRALHTLQDETPAHLLARPLWLDAAAMQAFTAVHGRWWRLWCAAQRRRFGWLRDDEPPAPDIDHQIALRSARNRLIDALGLADTCPLTDLSVADGSPGGPIKVAFGRSAQITIDESETGMRYALLGPDGRPLLDAAGAALAPITVDGNGGRVQLATPPVTDDISFRIQVSKPVTVAGQPAQPALLLTQGVAVKVGLDLLLLIELPGLPLLDATLANAQPGDTRVVDFGARVRLQVHLSQEGVAYALGLDGTPQAGPVIGNLGTIELLSPPLAEDTVLGVQATKSFTGGGGGSTGGGTGGAQDQQWLAAQLRVAVKANTALQALAQPGPVIDAGLGSAALRLPASQGGVAYRLFARRVPDGEWQRDVPADSATLLLRAAPDQPALPAVGLPLRPDGWQPTDGWRAPQGFVAVGDAPLAGTGADLDLPLGAPADDAVYLVQAIKAHTAGQTTINTEVGLAQAVLVLVRPSATPPLQLALVQGLDAAAAPELQVAGGQPGVYYHFTAQPDGPALPLPAYQHQADERDPASSKGLGQLTIGIDFALARGRDPATEPPPRIALALGQQPVPPPRLRLGLAADAALAANAVLAIRAQRAMTGLDTPLASSVQLLALPAVRIDPTRLAPGASAQVQVASSLPGDLHQLLLQGQPIGAPVPGTEAGLSIDTGPLLADSVFELVITAGQPGTGLPLQRRLALGATLLPCIDLALTARRDSLAAGESTEIMVAASQPGVAYQLRAGELAVGAPVLGTGAEINLPSGPISADTRFTVAATRTDDALASVLLAAELRISLRAAG